MHSLQFFAAFSNNYAILLKQTGSDVFIMPAICLITAAILISPLFLIFDPGEGTLAGGVPAFILYLFLIFYSFFIRRKREGFRKTCFTVSGIAFTCYLLSPLLLPNICGPTLGMIMKSVPKANLTAIYEAQEDYYNRHKQYAGSMDKLGFNVKDSRRYNYNYRYYINNSGILKPLAVEIPKDGYVAVVIGDRFRRGKGF